MASVSANRTTISTRWRNGPGRSRGSAVEAGRWSCMVPKCRGYSSLDREPPVVRGSSPGVSSETEPMTTPTANPSIEIMSFPVEGMTCASCVNRITRFLQKLDGVNGAEVNLATESATVRFDPARVGPADLASAVDAAGYVARIDQSAGDTRDVAIERVAESRTDRDKAAARHLASLRRRVIVAAALTVPLLGGLARMTVAPGLPAILSEPVLQLAVATPIQFWAGWPFLSGAWHGLRRRSADMDTLIGVGTSAAFGYSVATILVPGFFRDAGIGANGAELPLYFDTAAAIVTLILLGRYLEARARTHTSEAIRRLVGLAPPP